MKVIVPQIEQISSNSMEGTRLSMTESEAEIFKTLKHEDLLKNVKYELLSFGLIKGLLDEMEDSAITITWDDTFQLQVRWKCYSLKKIACWSPEDTLR